MTDRRQRTGALATGADSGGARAAAFKDKGYATSLTVRDEAVGRNTASVSRPAGGNMSSLSGQAGMQAFAAYTVAKHDAAELTKPPALEYGDQKLRVSAICPVAVDKPHVE